jgi:hypothetical protein
MSARAKAVAVLLMCLAATAIAKKSKPKPPLDQALSKVLDQQGEAIGKCAVAALDGAASIEIAAQLMVNNRGQVMDCKVTVAPAGERTAQARACVERVLRAAPFPKTRVPLITLARTWKFSTE